ncbi:hypothetical protein DIPPA_07164 [Diplonema papillatum]|nr:hypothetical protein DIPPA_07164 [Diplonema papillatum]
MPLDTNHSGTLIWASGTAAGDMSPRSAFNEHGWQGAGRPVRPSHLPPRRSQTPAGSPILWALMIFPKPAWDRFRTLIVRDDGKPLRDEQLTRRGDAVEC